jgi:hypothetical protein
MIVTASTDILKKRLKVSPHILKIIVFRPPKFEASKLLLNKL